VVLFKGTKVRKVIIAIKVLVKDLSLIKVNELKAI
jgi:hypothetical protein